MIIFSSLLLFSCSTHLIQAEEIIPEELYCGSTIGQFLKNNKNYISKESENIGAVNIITKKDSVIYGDNTDIYGVINSFDGIDISKKKGFC